MVYTPNDQMGIRQNPLHRPEPPVQSGFLTRLGFTLIELLVVIPIIAIIAALLLPAFNKSKLKEMVVDTTEQASVKPQVRVA